MQGHYRQLLLGALIFFISGGAATADLRVCNTTKEVVGVAIGYRGKSQWISQGWWSINPNDCQTLLDGPLKGRFYYFHAEEAKGRGRWEGPVPMCVKESKFTINGVEDCFVRGFQKVGFQEIDTGAQANWMIQLSDDIMTPNTLDISGVSTQ